MALTQVNTGGIADGAVTTNDLENSGVTAGTYGSSSAIPAITVDAKGRITSASTNSVSSVGGASGVDFNDSVKARFGTGNDFEILHNGTDNVIRNVGDGDILIDQNRDDGDIILRSDNGSGGIATYLRCDGSNGQVDLYHYGSSKLNTTSGGVNVTGTVTCDGITSDGDITLQSANGNLIIKDTDNDGVAAQQRIIGQDSAGNTDWYVGQVGTGNNDLYVSNNNSAALVFRTGAAERAYFNANGHFQPWTDDTYDLGTSTHQWRNGYFDGTVYVDTLEAEGPSRITNGDLQIHNSTGPQLRLRDDNSTGDAAVSWLRGENSNGAQMWYLGDTNADGAINLINSQNNNLYFGTNGSNRCQLDANGHLSPVANNTYDLGTSSLRWRNVYTNDLNLSNEGGANDVDGTWGSWTIQEGEDDLFLLNRRSGKKYKFNLTEVS